MGIEIIKSLFLKLTPHHQQTCYMIVKSKDHITCSCKHILNAYPAKFGSYPIWNIIYLIFHLIAQFKNCMISKV